MNKDSLKRIPQVDKLLLTEELAPLREKYPKLVTGFAREAVVRSVNGRFRALSGPGRRAGLVGFADEADL